MSEPRCARCGYERREHSYNGACYGLCGEFVERTAMMPSQDRIEHAARALWNATVAYAARHYPDDPPPTQNYDELSDEAKAFAREMARAAIEADDDFHRGDGK
jgi:hypothetical protein